MTTAQCVAVLKVMPKKLPNAVRSGMGKGLRFAAADAQSAFAQSGIGRGLLGKGDFGPVSGFARASKSLIRSETRVMPNGSVVGKLIAVGMAALRETGGRTKPHVIKVGSNKGALTLKGFIKPFAMSVHHPGSKIPAHPYLEAALRRNEARIRQEIERAITKAYEKFAVAA